VSHHLSPVPDEPAPLRREPDEVAPWPGEDLEPLRRPRWWRWVALAVVLALVVATPLAYGVSILLR
jgi:hypothetical protein